MENDYYYFLNTDKKKEIWIQNLWLGGRRLEVLWLENAAYWKLKCTNVPGSSSVVEAMFCPFFIVFWSLWAKLFFFPLVWFIPTKSTVGVGLKSFASTYPICAQRPSLEAPGSPPALGVPAGSRNAGGRRCCQGENGWHQVLHPDPACGRSLPPPRSFFPLRVSRINPNYLSFPFRMNKDHTLMWIFSPNKWPLNNQKDFYLCNILDFSYVMAVERR